MKIKDFILKQAIKYIFWFVKQGGCILYSVDEFNITCRSNERGKIMIQTHELDE